MSYFDKPIWKSNVFRLTILSILFLELLSFFAWALPVFNNICFFVILFLVLILSLEDLRYGVAIALAELIIGSHGYLFSFNIEGLSVSIRMGIFVVLFAIGLLKVIREKNFEFYNSYIFWPFVLFFIFLSYATIRGVLINNGFSNVFFDVNGFVFFALALPMWQAFRKMNDLKILIEVSIAALFVGVIKVLFLLYVFSHKFWWMLLEVYQWVRDTRVGEITQITDQFFRIFFQSQLYTIIGFFFVLLSLAYLVQGKKINQIVKEKNAWIQCVFAALLFSSILISFSRSNWMGVLVAGVCIIIVIWLANTRPIKQIVSSYIISMMIGIFSIIIITVTVLFPFPPSSGVFSAGSLISKRALTLTGEAGVSSRWLLLPPLWGVVSEHWFLGSGFGKEVTFITQDPRILAQSPTGETTTFVFEWGYLDLWLKLGIMGLIVYVYLIFVIFKKSILILYQNREKKINQIQKILVQGLILGGVSVLVTHAFSPYLNHPLGIGYLLFWALGIDIIKKSHKFSIPTEMER